MKKLIKKTLLLVAMPLACLCSKNEAPETKGELVTISASIDDSKVTMNPGTEAEDPALKLAWETTDQIVVEGTTTSTFTVSSLDGPHKAYFTGEAPQGSVFNIYYPNKDILTRSYESQTQNGNASTAHLTYNAIEEGVADYKSVSFSKVNGAVKLVVKVPATVTAVSSIAITSQDSEGVAQNVFYKTNDAESEKTSTITIGFSDGTAPAEGVLTAYAMVSWNTVELAANSRINITLTVPGQTSTYQKTIKLSKATTVAGGQTFILDMSGATIKELQYTLAGAGTEADPYKIYTKEDMQAVKAHLAKKDSDTEATYFELMNDVDMGNAEFTPLANGSKFYKIDFTSNGAPTTRYTLKNVSINDPDERYVSIFGALNGSVHDVNFDNIQVTTTKYELAAVICAFLGGLADEVVGYVENVNITNSSVEHTYSDGVVTGVVCGNFARGQINNVNINNKCTAAQTVTGTISKDCAIGGIAGITKKDVPAGQEYSIKNCVCSAKVDVKSSKSTKTLFGGAGILGQVKNAGILIDNTTFSGQLVTVANINNYHFGGIVAYNTANNLTITNCTNTASVNLTQHYFGGIIGRSTGENLSITDCTNSGTITTTKNYTCGIAGEVGTGTTISGCSNTSSISGAEHVSGIVGLVGESCNVSGCTNSGTITGTSKLVAGIVAEAGSSLKVSSCTNTNKITGGMNTAGIVGRSMTATITSCSNSGEISTNGQHYSAGILAGSYNGDDSEHPLTYAITISKCSNTGSVINASKNRVAGIVGDAGPASQISECFNKGAISGGSYVGGIVGALQKSTSDAKGKISDCYSISTIKVTTQLGGGIVGELYDYNDIYSCYAGGEILKNGTKADEGRALGGIIGRAAGAAWSAAGKSFNNEIKYVVSWLDKIVAGGTASNGSSGIVTGFNATKTSYTYCYRRADSDVSSTFTNCPSGVAAPCNQGQTTSNVTTGITNDTANYKYWYPYHANTVNKTNFPSVASVVAYVNTKVSNAWSSTIWDLTKDYPTLLNNPEPTK